MKTDLFCTSLTTFLSQFSIQDSLSQWCIQNKVRFIEELSNSSHEVNNTENEPDNCITIE